MAYEWTEESIKWYLDASRYGDFHERLAAAIRPFLKPEDTLCDLGCGLGCLDLLLAEDVRLLTGLDVDERVLSQLSREAQRRGIQNLRTLKGDAAQMEEEYDVVLMAFFGSPESLMHHCLQRSRRLFVRVVNDVDGGELQPKNHYRKKDTAERVGAQLQQWGYPHKLLRLALEFGQPLASQADALAFLRHTAPKAQDAELEEFLRQRLTETGREDFPYYLPYLKRMGVLIVEKGPER